jgi:hypothetical protein
MISQEQFDRIAHSPPVQGRADPQLVREFSWDHQDDQ